MNNCGSIAPLPRSSAEQGPRLSQDLGVRILPPQPASAVSVGRFRILRKHPRLPRLKAVVVGLCARKISLVSRQSAILRTVSPVPDFPYPEFLAETRFATAESRIRQGDLNEPAISIVLVKSGPPDRCCQHRYSRSKALHSDRLKADRFLLSTVIGL